MRIQPVVSRYSNTNRSQTIFEKKNHSTTNSNINNHKYTGNISVDLAYASMLDKNIENDLRSMGFYI